jgi:hypothetical protein
MDYLSFSFQLLSGVVSSHPIGNSKSVKLGVAKHPCNLSKINESIIHFPAGPLFHPVIEAIFDQLVNVLSSEPSAVMYEPSHLIGGQESGRSATEDMAISLVSIAMVEMFQIGYAVFLPLVCPPRIRW